MKNYLIFGGTTEGTQLAKALSEAGHRVTVSVATEYGALMLEGCRAEVLVGRMDENEMAEYMKKPGFSAVLDATHPYAEEVTKNIRSAAEKAGLSYERVLRPDDVEEEGWLRVPDAAAAAERLKELPGNILLTTGSKELLVFCGIPDYQKRVWVRILASEASLHQALSWGYPASHIIAMHGPFSQELNVAMIHQFSIQTLVTKRSGRAGGFWEKAEAARQTGARLLVIDRPVQETGLSLEEAVKKYGGNHED